MQSNKAANRLDEKSFSEQYVQHKDRLVFRLLSMTRNREAAEDIAASAFATALEKLDTFRGDAALSTWINAIATNEFHTWKRQKPTVPLESTEISGSKAFVAPDLLEQTHDRAECIHRIREVLRRVPVVYRRTLNDHFIKGYSIRKIAKRHKIPQGTVLSRLFKGKQFLREAWAV